MNCPTCNKPGYAKEPGFHCENCGTYESVHADQCKVPALVPAVVLLLGAVDELLDELPADDESRRSIVFYVRQVLQRVCRILNVEDGGSPK